MQPITRIFVSILVSAFCMLIVTEDKQFALLMFPAILIYLVCFEYIEHIIEFFTAPKEK